jgi:hypothetical protein
MYWLVAQVTIVGGDDGSAIVKIALHCAILFDRSVTVNVTACRPALSVVPGAGVCAIEAIPLQSVAETELVNAGTTPWHDPFAVTV